MYLTTQYSGYDEALWTSEPGVYYELCPGKYNNKILEDLLDDKIMWLEWRKKRGGLARASSYSA